MNSFEQHPHDYSEVNAHLRQLIINNVVSVQAENDQHQTFFRQMQSDAAEFAATMNSLPGVWTESTNVDTKTPSTSLFGRAQTQQTQYDFWVIRENTRYGGSSLAHGKTDDPLPSALSDVIVIMTTGELEIITRDIYNEGIFYYLPGSARPSERFVDRKPFDNSGAGPQLRAEWVRDLEKAARKYGRTTR